MPKFKKVKIADGFIEIHFPCGLCAIIDKDNAKLLELYKSWSICKRGRTNYVEVIDQSRKRNYLHRIIMKDVPRETHRNQIDHINRNGLDNRKSNLRWVTGSENRRNLIRSLSKKSSKYRGVYLNGRGQKKWTAQIKIGGKMKTLGYFTNEDAAARCYNDASKAHFPSIGWQNEIQASLTQDDQLQSRHSPSTGS